MKGMNGIIAAAEAPVLNYAERNPKFRQEKVCAETERYLVHFDGILLDHGRPCEPSERFALLKELYEQFGALMTAHLKGQYHLVIWDKRAQKMLVTNDLLSKRPLYYCIQGQRLLYAASYRDLIGMLRSCGSWQPRLNANAVSMMSLNGTLAGEETYLADVRYLDAFQAIEVEHGKVVRIVSIDASSRYAASTMDEAIGVFDQLFTQAVQAQFRKNAEYGYDHFVALSGGMDSRACLLKAVQCGFDRGITCINYSPSGSIDNMVSQQIAFDHQLDYLFYPMDAAVFMTRLSDALACNECQQSSIGSTGARTIARLLDKRNIGLMHVGLCGGELMGDLVECASNTGRVQRIMARLGLSKSSGADYRFHIRSYLDNVRACQNFSQMFQDDCETVSPFLDEDVVQFVIGLDPQLLYRRSLYREWMKKEIPNSYTTTMFCGPIDISPAREILNKIVERLIRHFAGTSRRDMNPFDHWLKNNSHLAQTFAEKYSSGLDSLQRAGISDEILDILKKSWMLGPEQRLYTLTAIAALKEVCVPCNHDQ